LVLPLVLLGLLEMGLRLGGYGFDPHFFKAITVAGRRFYVQNDGFSFRFFPKEIVRHPSVLRMPAHKAPGTYRIFIFGESAAQGDPEPSYGVGRYLEMLLREKLPDTKFEVVNVAFTAINSHVIVPIARECARHDGDFWIIYMGNNEMVGPFGAATVFGRPAAPLPYVRLVTAIQRTRTGQLFTALARWFRGHGARFESWGGMEMFLQNRIPPDSPLKENVYRNFQKNLDDIIRAGLDSGAKVLLNTVAVNLKDCPPFATLTNSPLPPADRAEFSRLCAAAEQSAAQSNYATAEQLFEQAEKLNGRDAELQYRWGQCLLAQNQAAAARKHLQQACDDDALPFRADSRLNGIIAAAGERHGGGQLRFFDAAKVLAGQTPDGVGGAETFYEHVHFEFTGSYRLGLAWAQQIETQLPPGLARRAGWASPEACDQLLCLSDWNRAQVVQSVINRMQLPPLNLQPNNAPRVEHLQQRVAQLTGRLNTNTLAATRENYATQLEKSPDDFLLRVSYAVFLLKTTGDLPPAIAEWRRIQDLIPHDFQPHFQLGYLLGRQGQLAEAEIELRAAIRIRPGLTEGWFELGNVLAAREKFSEALACYSVARQQHTQETEVAFRIPLRIGGIYARLNRHAEALQFYREAVRLNPTNWEPHFKLGGELNGAGQPDAARDELAEAVRLNPDHAPARYNYGAVLANQGRFDEAQRQFEESLRLDPGFEQAREGLGKLRAVKQWAPQN
jgi:tetratricopeptide (TPR) repeat protein